MKIFTLWCDDIYLGSFSTARLAMTAAYESLHQDIFPETRGIKQSDLATLTRAHNQLDWPRMQKIAREVLGWEYRIKAEALDIDIESVVAERINDSGFWVADGDVEKLKALEMVSR